MRATIHLSMQGSSSKSASAVGVDAGHSRSRRRSVTDVGLPLAGTHRPGSLHRFSENLRRIRGCPRGRQSRRPLQRPLLSPVGADDSVRPQTAPVLTGIYGESVAAQRADVGIGPYMTPANSCCPANFECKAEKMGPPEARRKRPRRNEPPRYARSLLSSASVSFFPNRKRFAGLRLGFGFDGYIKQPHSGRMGLFMHIWVGEVILRK